MKVVNLIIESIKRVKNVVITPKGWTVKIAGKNKQGKTSILDSLMFILEGEKNIPGDPRHSGENKGRIDADFGGLRITRTFTDKGSTLTVTDASGEVQKAQTFLNNLLGNNATDVMSFMSKPPAKQREILVKLTGADTSAVDEKIDAIFANRTRVGNEVERLQSVLRSSKWVNDIGSEEVSAETMRKQLDEVLEHNQKIKKAQRARTSLVDDIEKLKKQITLLEKSIIEKLEELNGVDICLVGEELRDESILFTQIRNIETDNSVRRENKKYEQTRESLRIQKKSYEEKTEQIEKLRAEKIALIAAAKFPIDGLSLGPDCVLFNGHPMQDASGAEQIMVGIAILSKIIPPEGIRILRCNNGSLIDDDNMRIIEELAEREQVQIWIECVQNSPSDGDGSEIFIEDGQVKK